MIKASLVILRAKASKLGAQFMDDVLTSGRVEGQSVLIDAKVYLDLVKKYRPPAVLQSVPVAVPHQALPLDEWPLWAKSLAKFATPQDKGIGDVVARVIGPETSQAFKAWFKTIFNKDCRCDGRQASWNARFPLPQLSTPDPPQP